MNSFLPVKSKTCMRLTMEDSELVPEGEIRMIILLKGWVNACDSIRDPRLEDKFCVWLGEKMMWYIRNNHIQPEKQGLTFISHIDAVVEVPLTRDILEEILINGFTPNLENLLNKKAGRSIYSEPRK